jgi:hypothetical protein
VAPLVNIVVQYSDNSWSKLSGVDPSPDAANLFYRELYKTTWLSRGEVVPRFMNVYDYKSKRFLFRYWPHHYDGNGVMVNYFNVIYQAAKRGDKSELKQDHAFYFDYFQTKFYNALRKAVYLK